MRLQFQILFLLSSFVSRGVVLRFSFILSTPGSCFLGLEGDCGIGMLLALFVVRFWRVFVRPSFYPDL